MWSRDILLDTVDLSISLEAEEGSLSSLDGRDFPSKLTFHLSYEAMKEASSLEVIVYFCYALHFVVVNVRVGANVTHSTRGAKVFPFFFFFFLYLFFIEAFRASVILKWHIIQNTKLIKVITYNVNGLGNPIKRSKIMAKLKREEIDVALLQETHLSNLEHEKLVRWRFNQYSSSYRQGWKRGVVILISKKLNFECIYEKKDLDGRFVLVQGYLQGALVTFLNVYAPPLSEWTFFKHIFELLVSDAQGTLICGGDFNVRLHPTLDASKPCYTREKKTSKNIKLMMRELGLCDTWRELNPTKKDYLFFSPTFDLF